MQKLNLVKAIVRYTPVNFTRQFVAGREDRIKGSARYLLLQKAKDTSQENIGKWECPGGRIHPKESSVEAISREMTEETGLTFRIVKQISTLESDKSVCDVYLIETSSMDVALSKEHSDYKWIKAEDVSKQDLVKYADLLLEFFNNPKKIF